MHLAKPIKRQHLSRSRRRPKRHATRVLRLLPARCIHHSTDDATEHSIDASDAAKRDRAAVREDGASQDVLSRVAKTCSEARGLSPGCPT